MADYIYLLENRLSPAQRSALLAIRELAKSKNLTVFLVGGAVRDLTTGSPVRDLDVVVQGNAFKLKKEIEKVGGVIAGEIDAAQTIFVTFPGGVRLEISSTLLVTYPKPGKPVYKPSGIQDDLRRRDFTANAMALSLNEGSYGLLMDPLNGIADIENRELRLVSNYGFIEDPVRMIRATRLMARLGWTMDEKTAQRYDAGKEEGYISALSELQRGYEAEEVVHEEDPLRVMRRLEAEGWMTHLAPFWTSAKADVHALEQLREVQTQLQMQGVHPDPSAANFPLLTARLSAAEIASLKASFVRQGFVKEIEGLEASAKELAAQLTGKAAALPSQSWKIITSAPPEAVLWVAYSTRSTALQAKFRAFSSTWPQARQKMPYALMQEMRIVPELAGYNELLESLFFELMDDKLQTPEEMRAFLEPFSPPAPPPPVSMRRPRAPKKESKAAKARAKKAIVTDAPDQDADDEDSSEEVEEVLTDALDVDDDEDGSEGRTASDEGVDDDAEGVDGDAEDRDAEADDEDDDPPPPSKAPGKKASANKAALAPVKVNAHAKAKDAASGVQSTSSLSSPTHAPAKVQVSKVGSAKPAPAKPAPVKHSPVKAAPAKSAGKPHSPAPVKRTAEHAVPARKPIAQVKTSAKSHSASKKVAATKVPAKTSVKHAPAKKVTAKKVASTAPAARKAPAAKKVARKR